MLCKLFSKNENSRIHKRIAAEYERSRAEMMETLVKQMAEAEGVTEALKRRDPMAWVGHMNSIRNRADEIVRNELIYV